MVTETVEHVPAEMDQTQKDEGRQQPSSHPPGLGRAVPHPAGIEQFQERPVEDSEHHGNSREDGQKDGRDPLHQVKNAFPAEFSLEGADLRDHGALKEIVENRDEEEGDEEEPEEGVRTLIRAIGEGQRPVTEKGEDEVPHHHRHEKHGGAKHAGAGLWGGMLFFQRKLRALRDRDTTGVFKHSHDRVSNPVVRWAWGILP
jgi:hypothetical protein